MLTNFREGNPLFWHQPHKCHLVVSSRATSNSGREHTGLGTTWTRILWLLLRTSQDSIACQCANSSHHQEIQWPLSSDGTQRNQGVRFQKEVPSAPAQASQDRTKKRISRQSERGLTATMGKSKADFQSSHIMGITSTQVLHEHPQRSCFQRTWPAQSGSRTETQKGNSADPSSTCR